MGASRTTLASSIIRPAPALALNAVEHVPQDLGLSDERGHTCLLQGSGRRFADDEVDRFLRVTASARDPATKIRQRFAVDPGVVPFPRRNPFRHQIGREKLGERRRDRYDERTLFDQRDVRIAGESNARQDIAAARYRLPIEPDRLGESDPLGEPPGCSAPSPSWS